MPRFACFAALSVAIGLLPVAFSVSLRGLMLGPPPFCFIEHGFDYVGNDLVNVPGRYDECCDKCFATFDCHAWSWTDHMGGTCWLKSARGEIVVNPSVKSSLFLRGDRPTCQISNDVDFVGNDLARVDGPTVESCCEACHTYPGCRAYSWSDFQGGSCWLKSKVTDVVNKPGVKSAQAYPEMDANDGSTVHTGPV